MNKELKRILLWIAAILFLILGVIGLALPFLQGFLFIAIGLILLSIVSPRSRTWWETHTRKYPMLHDIIMRAEKRIAAFIGE